MSLNHVQISALKATGKPYRKTIGDGLYVQVSNKGSKSFRYRYRFNGKENIYTIGKFPVVTLAIARERHQEARVLLAQNIDPNTHKKKLKVKQAYETKNTFKALAEDYFKHREDSLTEKTMKRNKAIIQTHVFGDLADRTLSEIKPNELLVCIEKIQAKGLGEVPKRAINLCSKIFCYGVALQRVESDPARDIKDLIVKPDSVIEGRNYFNTACRGEKLQT